MRTVQQNILQQCQTVVESLWDPTRGELQYWKGFVGGRLQIYFIWQITSTDSSARSVFVPKCMGSTCSVFKGDHFIVDPWSQGCLNFTPLVIFGTFKCKFLKRQNLANFLWNLVDISKLRGSSGQDYLLCKSNLKTEVGLWLTVSSHIPCIWRLGHSV